MDKSEQIYNQRKEKVVKISLDAAFELINNLNSTRDYNLYIENIVNGELKCRLEKSKRHFKFNVHQKDSKILAHLVSSQIQDHILNKSKLKCDDITILTEKTDNASLKLADLIDISGEFSELKSESFNDVGYSRVVIPINESQFRISDLTNGKDLVINDNLCYNAYTCLSTNYGVIGIYDFHFERANYLIVDCHYEIFVKEVELLISSITNILGLSCGYYMRDEMYIIQYDNIDLTNVSGIKYKRLDESAKGIAAIKTLGYSTGKLEQIVKTNVFENLINKCIADIRFLRTLKTITESFNYPLISRASMYSVALETLKNIIIEENEKALNPFKNKKKASETIRDLKQIILDIDEAEFNSKESVIKKLTYLNQLGNKESFLKMFNLMKIELNKDDVACIENRNDFLHGRIPFENEADSDYKLAHIVYKLHFLISTVIYKYNGYSGHIVNNAKYVDMHYFKQLQEPIYRMI